MRGRIQQQKLKNSKREKTKYKIENRYWFTAMDDAGAKRIFQIEEVRKRFLSATLELPLSEIKSTRILNTHLLRRWKKDKEGIVDILIELNDQTKVIIEIQVAEIKYWDNRNLYYLARTFCDGITSGENYTELKKCISISILDFDYLRNGKCHSKFLFRDEKGEIYSELLEVHIIDINNTTEENEEIKEWAELFRCRRKEELEKLNAKTKNPGIKAAIGELKEMSLSKTLRAEWEYHLKQRRDRVAREEFVYDEGAAYGRMKGKEEGIVEGKIEAVDRIRKELHLDLEKACSIMEISVEEYQRIKEK